MTVLLNKGVRASLFAKGFLYPQYVYCFDGAMPTTYGVTISDIIDVDYAANLICTFGTSSLDNFDMDTNVAMKGWEATRIAQPALAVKDGTITWFLSTMYLPNQFASNPYDYFVSDSVATTGTSALLVLDSLNAITGNNVTAIDFSLSSL